MRALLPTHAANRRWTLTGTLLVDDPDPGADGLVGASRRQPLPGVAVGATAWPPAGPGGASDAWGVTRTDALGRFVLHAARLEAGRVVGFPRVAVRVRLVDPPCLAGRLEGEAALPGPEPADAWAPRVGRWYVVHLVPGPEAGPAVDVGPLVYAPGAPWTLGTPAHLRRAAALARRQWRGGAPVGA